MTPLSTDEVKHIAAESAREAVRQLLVAMGVDANDPKALIEMQKDFAHIRNWRRSVDTLRTKSFTTAIGIVVAGIGGAIWLAVKSH